MKCGAETPRHWCISIKVKVRESHISGEVVTKLASLYLIFRPGRAIVVAAMVNLAIRLTGNIAPS